MAEKNVNKIVYAGETLIDLTQDTVDESKVLAPATFHKPDGSIATGTNTFDADTKDATATDAEILASKTAYKNGAKVTGTMPNRGKQTGSISTKTQSVIIQNGYHDGSGAVSIDSTEQAKIIAGNIKNGVEILGVEGTYTGSERIKATTGSATPAKTSQQVLPSGSGDYDYFTQFTVNAIPYTETENAAGGKTVTIAGSAS